MSRISDRPQQDVKAGLPQEQVGNRFMTTYNPEIALEIVEKIAEGELLREICIPGSKYPHPVTFKRWMVRQPDLAKAYEVARELSASSLEEEAIDIGRRLSASPGTGTNVRAKEVLMTQLRWSAERRDPAKFGNKTNVSIRVPIQINTSLDLGSDGTGNVNDKDIYSISGLVDAQVEEKLDQLGPDHKFKPVVEGKPIIHRRLTPFQKRSIEERKEENEAAIRSESRQRGRQEGKGGHDGD